MEKKEIKHIHCTVKNCEYHSPDSRCMAGNITVGTQNACSCGETACETFKMSCKDKTCKS
ncbi:MAG: DUF1540 domain-containing protein [Clostridia bacterium]|nr:DUF1540 domain-containing protein [Clostridia bacterium]MBR6780964.1 DUF1540 domain-containing protein [Clostridia bacterium]